MISIVLIAILTSGNPAAPSTLSTAPTLASAASPEAPKKERQICKRQPISGTLHGSKRVCMTAREWRHGKGSATYEDLSSVTTK